MPLAPPTTAVLLIEYQNEFTTEGGVLHGAVAGVMKETDMLRTAYEHGFDVITLKDCTAATSSEAHHNAINFDFPMFSTPMTSGDVIAQFPN